MYFLAYSIFYSGVLAFEIEDISRFIPHSFEDLFFLIWMFGLPAILDGIAAIPLCLAARNTKKMVLITLMILAFSWEYFVDVCIGLDELFVYLKVGTSISLFVLMYWKLLFGQRTD